MASEPKMDVSNVQSCSHEKELFVLLLQTEEKMGCSFHLPGCMYTPWKLKIKTTAHLELNRVLELSGSHKPNQPVLVLSVCVQCSCLLCVIRRVWLSPVEPLRDVGPCSLKRLNYARAAETFLCNKITHKRLFFFFKVHTAFFLQCGCMCSSDLGLFFHGLIEASWSS